MQKQTDWFYELKMEVLRCSDLLTELRKDMVFMLETNRWVLEDINLCESFCNLQEMVEISYQELTQFVGTIYSLEKDMSIFNMQDLVDQFDYIQENIQLQSMYMNNMVNYMEIINNSSTTVTDIVRICSQYSANDNAYLNQMKLNNESLKQLKKERRDYLE